MVALQFVPVNESEQDRAFATLVVAFVADPVERWLYPDAHQYLTHFPAFLSAFGGKAFAEKTVWRARRVFRRGPLVATARGPGRRRHRRRANGHRCTGKA